MYVHPEIRRQLAADRLAALQRSATPFRRAEASSEPAREPSSVALRLCRSDDDPALAVLAQLSERAVPAGRLVLALVDDRIVAALPLAGGEALRDPFVRTCELINLLELRAAQLRTELRPGRRRSRAFGVLGGAL